MFDLHLFRFLTLSDPTTRPYKSPSITLLFGRSHLGTTFPNGCGHCCAELKTKASFLSFSSLYFLFLPPYGFAVVESIGGAGALLDWPRRSRRSYCQSIIRSRESMRDFSLFTPPHPILSSIFLFGSVLFALVVLS